MSNGVKLKNKKISFLINITVMANYYIHKCSYAKSPPLWNALKINSLYLIHVENGLKMPFPGSSKYLHEMKLILTP